MQVNYLNMCMYKVYVTDNGQNGYYCFDSVFSKMSASVSVVIETCEGSG